MFLRVEHTEEVSMYLISAKAFFEDLYNKCWRLPSQLDFMIQSERKHFIQDIGLEEWTVFVINRVKEIRHLQQTESFYRVRLTRMCGSY